MKIEQILENILDGLAKESVKATNHFDRTRKDKTAYAIIRELYGEEEADKIKYYDNYYFSVKRSLIPETII